MRRRAPLAAENREALLAAARRVLPASGTVLELASGTGEHAVFLAARLPALAWQPSDPDPEARASIAAWAAEAGLPNLRPPLDLDVRLATWWRQRADAVLCLYLLHVAPPDAAAALAAGAARVLPPGGPLLVGGPFREGGRLPPGRERLERSLRAADPALGIPDREAVVAAAAAHGLRLEEVAPLTRGDRLLVFRRGT